MRRAGAVVVVVLALAGCTQNYWRESLAKTTIKNWKGRTIAEVALVAGPPRSHMAYGSERVFLWPMAGRGCQEALHAAKKAGASGAELQDWIVTGATVSGDCSP